MAFEIRTHKVESGALVVELRGELDMEAYSRFRDEFLQSSDGKSRMVAVDLSRLTFINSYGLAVFAEHLNQSHIHRNRLRFFGASPSVREIFDMTVLSSFMEFCQDRREALMGV